MNRRHGKQAPGNMPPLVYPPSRGKHAREYDEDLHNHNHNYNHTNTNTNNVVVASAEVQDDADSPTPLLVDAARAPTAADLRAIRLQEAERRAAVAEAERQAAVEKHQRQQGRVTLARLGKAIANLTRCQWVGVGIVVLGLILMVATAVMVGVLCRAGQCRDASPADTSGPSPAAADPNMLLSIRAQDISNYINAITLTGRTLTYPDLTTPEGRALAWLIHSDDDETDEMTGTTTNTTPAAVDQVTPSPMTSTTHSLIVIRQRYALATLWFQTPANFETRLASVQDTWGTARDECDWYGVTCVATDVGRVVQSIQLGEKVGVQGHIPPDLALLNNLTSLELSSNSRLTGTIPLSLGTFLTNLQSLGLFNNALHGTIPSSFRSLTSLNELVLLQNHLIGTVPSSLDALTNLTILFLHGNGLTGTIPPSIGSSLKSLSALTLYSNRLSGSIPSSLGALTALVYLRLFNNTLTGTIPPTLSNLPVLQHLHLFQNTLTGTIPPSMATLPNLTELQLYENDLSGPIPLSLGNLTFLESLALGANTLTGTIPASLGALPALTELRLDVNQLIGTIPSSLGNLSLLRSLLLGNNNLTGTIPNSLGDLRNLTFLSMQNNALTGTIISALGNLTALGLLSLRGNPLIGTVPSSLEGLTALTEMYLFNSQITGTMPLCANVNQAFKYLVADCDKVSCPCCTHCCPTGGWNGTQGYEKCDERKG
jgi:Leucine-rich repeat (LRR) protein